MIKREFETIVHNKGLMLAMVAIILIPFIYSFCFLTSAWDPYGNTGKIPVAVVNLDKPATLSGKTIQAGADTVSQLHDDNQLEWHFVSAAKAKKGLKDNKYYTVVTIPEDFSKDAATVLDAHPKQMKLTYETNGSLNYVSEIISQVGADKLNSQIKEKVTTAFVNELFSQVDTIGKGMKTAATGAKTLKTGISQYTDGVVQVDNGLTQLNNNVPTLASGVKQLNDGGTQLVDGLGQLNGKVPTLSSGVKQLSDGVVAYTDGADQITSGISKLYDKSIANKSQNLMQLSDGLSSLNGQVPTLASGVKQLYAGINEINAEVNGATADTDLKASVQALTTGIGQLADGLTQMQTASAGLPGGVAKLSTAMTKLQKTVTSQIGLFRTFYSDAKYPAVSSLLGTNSGFDTEKKQLAANQSTADKNMEAAIANVTDPDQKAVLEAAFKSDKTASAATTSKLNTAYMVLNTVKYNLTTEDTDTANDPKGLLTAVTQINAGLTQVNSGVNDPQTVKGSSEKLTFAQSLAKLVAGANQLNAGLGTLNGKAPKLASGIAQLQAGLKTLNANVPALSSGVGQLNAGAQTIYNGTTDPTGVADDDLTLTQALTKLNNGGQTLSSNSTTLKSGSGQLNAAVPTLSSGVGQLYTGSKQLSTGLNQLNGKVPTLSSGVKQLKDGTSQLTANNQKLNDGTKQLSTGLSDGYKQIAATKLTKLTAKMFANPSQDVQKKYTSVKNYGAALAPYVLALALFIAIIIFNFAYPMKREQDDDRTLLQWIGGKLLIGTLVALAAGFIEATLILLVGLPVAHIVGFYAMTLLFALSAMYLTQMLNLAFNRVGIFIALGLLTLSGSGGLFPAETISPLYEATQKFLPMTYAINGYRDAISGGIAGGTVTTSVIVLLVIAILSVVLMIPATRFQSTWNSNAEK